MSAERSVSTVETKKAAPKTVVVNCLAGPGAGKTTSAWHMAAELKKLGFVVEYVPEYAKELVWEERLDLLNGSIENQRILLKEQCRRIERLNGKVDFIVTDSPIILNAIYLNSQSKEEREAYNMEVFGHFKRYKNFCLFVCRGKSFEKAGRIHGEQESKEKDKEILNLLDGFGIYYGIYHHATIDVAIKNCTATWARFNPQKQEMHKKSCPEFEGR